MKRLLLIINPHAGKQQSKGVLFELVEICTAMGYETTVMPTQGGGKTAQLVRERAACYERIICCGGDGTLGEVIAGLMACPVEQRPPLGYIPAGTTNDLATSLGIEREPLFACRGIFSSSGLAYDVGSFQKNRWFSYIAAFGAFTEVSYQTPQPLKNTLGHLAYVLEGAKRLSDLHPYSMRVRHDNGEVEGTFIFGAVCNTRSIGGLLRFYENEVNLSDGLFELLLVRMPRSIADLGRLIAGMRTRHFEEVEVVFLHTREVELFCEEEVAWSLDGEDGGAHRQVAIKSHPGAIRLQYGAAVATVEQQTIEEQQAE